MRSQLAERICRALDAADRGDLRDLDGAWQVAEGAREEEAGWVLALAAARVLFGKDAPEPTARDLEATVDRLGAARACEYLERLCLLRFDGVGLAALTALHQRLADDARPETKLGAQAAVLWGDVLRGGGDLEVSGRALHVEALRLQCAGVVIDATVQRAMGALDRGDPALALAHARRGSRMARAEGLVGHEWLAHLVLARVRRITGKPHLALQILTALVKAAPRPWWAWLSWELILAGGHDVAEPLLIDLRGRDDVPALNLAAMFQAAVDGDRSGFDAQALSLAGNLTGFPALAEEAVTAAGALDVRKAATAALESWRRGDTVNVPLGLQAICRRGEEPVGQAIGFVVVSPGAHGARVLRSGLPLLPGGVEADRAYAQRRGGRRTDVGLAVLACVGPQGLRVDDFFVRIWGFSYVARIHRGALEVTAKRMRLQVETRGDVLRQGDQVALRADVELVLPDPRCISTPAEYVLRLLSRDGLLRAVEAAQALGVPLRTVQLALQQLVSDGACRAEREGKQIHYRVVDTTFTAITDHGRP